MERLTALVCLSFSLLLSGCATYLNVATDYDDQFQFSGQSSYALIIPKDISNVRNDLLKNRIERALRNELQKKGLTETDKDNADIWVSYFATNEKQQDIRTYHSYNMFYGYSRCYRCIGPSPVFFDTEIDIENYTEGTLMIDIISPKDNKLKWRGTTRSRMTTSAADSLSVEERTAKVNGAVAAILGKYPPQ